MHEMQMIAERFHIALVGSLGAPKTKPREGYTAKRDTIFGSAVWSRMAETIITLQYPDGDDTANRRAVSVLPRNAAAETFEMEFQQGKLEIAAPMPEPEHHPTQKEKEAETVAIRAELFIQTFLQDGAKWGKAVIEAAKLQEGLGKNAVQEAAARLYQRKVLTYGKDTDHTSIWELKPIEATAEAIQAREDEVSQKNFNSAQMEIR